MNVQRGLIDKLMLHEFELGHNVTEATKNTCWGKSEAAVDHSRVTWWLEKFRLQEPGRPKTVDSWGRTPSHTDKSSE